MKPSYIFILLFVSSVCIGKTLSFSSSEKQTQLIELYTSEGCSSCPPADRWLSRFTENDDLWKKYIPVAFHVDYWDYIGWKDVFAKHENSVRQKRYHREGGLSSVYTPGILVNGQEWRGYSGFDRSLPDSDKSPGILQVILKDKMASVSFENATQSLSYHLVLLGMNIESNVKRGENSGKLLKHDFVVLDHQTTSGVKSAEFNLNGFSRNQSQQFAIAVWISNESSLKPIQATGGMLPENYFLIAR